MVIGVLIGLAAGVADRARVAPGTGARASSAAHLAEARLADAKLTVTEQSVQLQVLSERAASADRARAVAQAELDLVREHRGGGRGRGPRRSASA